MSEVLVRHKLQCPLVAEWLKIVKQHLENIFMDTTSGV